MVLSPFLAAVVLLAGGAVACFFGHRLFRFGLALLGFVIGALVATAFFGDGTAPLAWFTGAVHGLFGTGTAAGLLIAAFRALYSLAVALLGGLVGAAILGWAYYLGWRSSARCSARSWPMSSSPLAGSSRQFC